MSERYDSLDKYYLPIDKVEIISKGLFWINAALTILVFFLNDFPVKNLVLYFYILTTIAYFLTDNYLSIFLIPDVEGKRRLQLLTNSFGVPLDNERTNKYYNNNLEPSLIKLGANVFENSLFASRVTLEMAKRERWKILILLMIWLVSMLIRTTNLELISIVAQSLFASTLIPSWLKLEILYRKNKEVFQCLYDVFLFRRNNEEDKKTTARLLDCVIHYESAKAYSGVKQSTTIFNKINQEVTVEWEEIKSKLELDRKL